MKPWMLRLCLVAACLGWVACVNASPQLDALLREAESVRSANPESFERLLRQANARRMEASPRQREKLDFLNAYALVFAGRYEDAISDARKLLESSSDTEMRFRTGALIVNSYGLLRQFADGLRQLDQTLKLVDKVESQELRLNGLGVAAFIYNQVGQYKLSLHYADRILEESAPERTLCFAGQSRLESLQNLDALPADDASILQVINKCAEQGEAAVGNFARLTLARKWSAQDQGEKAITLLRDHLGEVERTRYPRLIGEVHSLLGELLLAAGDVAGAEFHARAAIAQKSGLATSPPLVRAYKTRYEIALRRDDLPGALEQYQHYAEADKAYLNDVKARELAYQIVRHETLQKTQEIELLNRRNQVLQLQQDVDRQSAQNTRLVVVLLVFLLAALGYWAWGIKRRQLSLRRLAEIDALTGISNRHHFTLQSERALAACARAGEPVALVMFDLDHFKAINDSYGHVTGDWVLARVAETCKAFCRRIDCLGRLGGEEFAFLMHGIDLAAAMRVAEDCRVRIASIDTHPSGHTFAITASFGVSTTALAGYDLARLLAQADQSLYRAKREGRNAVRVFSADAPTAPAVQVIAIDGRTIS